MKSQPQNPEFRIKPENFHSFILIGVQSEQPWLAGNPRPLGHIYSDCLIQFNISSMVPNADSFQKFNFSKIFPFKHIRNQIWY